MKWKKNYNSNELAQMARLRKEIQDVIFNALFEHRANLMREDVVQVLYQIIEEQNYLIITEEKCNKYLQKRVDNETEGVNI